mmetsp:Transcript_36183/g.86225  ORF Transcript_36183/g.86225 Transcript_36183/m.86225 type:complete len:202 (-) Transcript_36183:1484-2089(-)
MLRFFLSRLYQPEVIRPSTETSTSLHRAQSVHSTNSLHILAVGANPIDPRRLYKKGSLPLSEIPPFRLCLRSVSGMRSCLCRLNPATFGFWPKASYALLTHLYQSLDTSTSSSSMMALSIVPLGLQALNHESLSPRFSFATTVLTSPYGQLKFDAHRMVSSQEAVAPSFGMSTCISMFTTICRCPYWQSSSIKLLTRRCRE